MIRYLLDANHLADAVRRVSRVRDRMNLTLLTTDQDFQALPDIPTENWLI